MYKLFPIAEKSKLFFLIASSLMTSVFFFFLFLFFTNDEKMCTLQLGGAQRVVLSMEPSHTLHVKVVLGSFGSNPHAQ